MENTKLVNEQDVIKRLPHGSGINYDWVITQDENGNITASNCYEAMNENGFYCHVYPFDVAIKVVGRAIVIGDITMEADPDMRECCGCGLREYLDDTIYQFTNGQKID